MPWPTSSNNDFTVAPARSATELTSAAALFHAYAASLPIDLAPQGFQQELDSLPGLYAPPGGELLLAKRGDHVLGCIAETAGPAAHRRVQAAVCAAPGARAWRGQGAGRRRHRRRRNARLWRGQAGHAVAS